MYSPTGVSVTIDIRDYVVSIIYAVTVCICAVCEFLNCRTVSWQATQCGEDTSATS